MNTKKYLSLKMPNQKPTYQDLEKGLNTLKAELEAQKEATREARK